MMLNRFTSHAAKLLRSQRPYWVQRQQPCVFFSSSARDHDSNEDDESAAAAAARPKDAFGGSSYQWEDPLRLRSQLNEEELAVWDAARSFCDGELMPGIVEANRHEIPCDKPMMKKMGEVGMLGKKNKISFIEMS